MSEKRAEVGDQNEPPKAVEGLVLAWLYKGKVIPKEKVLFLQL